MGRRGRPSNIRHQGAAALEEGDMHKGSCLCGAIRFEVGWRTARRRRLPLQHVPQGIQPSAGVDRRARGAGAAGGADRITGSRSSPKVKRGFCSVCGSNLFWKPIASDKIAIAMGAFEAPTGGHLDKHVFVADKGDYCVIGDGLPRKCQSRRSFLPLRTRAQSRVRKAMAIFSNSALRSIIAQWPQFGKTWSSALGIRRIGTSAPSSGLTRSSRPQAINVGA